MNKDQIVAFRKKLGVSQERFAQLLGATFATINRWESGKTIPSRLYIKELEQMANQHGFEVHRCKEHERSSGVCGGVSNGDAVITNPIIISQESG